MTVLFLQVAFIGLRYSVPNRADGTPYTILDGVTAAFSPGKMTALMGPSGCGKTTLLDALSGRKTAGKVEGTVLYGGMAPTQAMRKARLGYVEQFDTLIPNLSVMEMLMYTAELKRPMREPIAEKRAAAENACQLLRLQACRHTLIGDPLHKGISGGQAKRVNIGLALVSDPAVIMLDEPTTGLDSFMANEVALCLRQIANDLNKTICATIHSPTSFAFNLFDDLLLLGGDGPSRGRVAFYGPLGKGGVAVRNHFEKIGYAFPTDAGAYSLVEWVVDVISGKFSLLQESIDHYREGGEDGAMGASVGANGGAASLAPEGGADVGEGEQGGGMAKKGKISFARSVSLGVSLAAKGKGEESDFAALYAESALCREEWGRVRSMLLRRGYSRSLLPVEADELGADEPVHEALASGPTEEPELLRAKTVKRATAVPWFWALWVLMRYRAMRNLTSIAFIAPRFADKMLTAFISATLFIGVGTGLDPQSIGSTVAVLFMVVALNGFGAASYVPTLAMDRALYYREVSDGLYRSIVYLLFNLLTELFVSAITAILYTLIVWWAIDLQGSLGIFFIVYYISSIVGITAAYAVAAVSPTLEVANAALPTYMVVNLFFAGFLIPLDKMPQGWRWYANIDPMRYVPKGRLALCQLMRIVHCLQSDTPAHAGSAGRR